MLGHPKPMLFHKMGTPPLLLLEFGNEQLSFGMFAHSKGFTEDIETTTVRSPA